MNVVHFSKEQEMILLYNKLYSFDHDAKSENKEVLEAMSEIDSIIDKNVIKIFDRGMDWPNCKNFIVANEGNFNVRLKKTTKLIYKGEEIDVNKISRKIPLFMKLTGTRIRKSKKHHLVYECGAIMVNIKSRARCMIFGLLSPKEPMAAIAGY